MLANAAFAAACRDGLAPPQDRRPPTAAEESPSIVSRARGAVVVSSRAHTRRVEPPKRGGGAAQAAAAAFSAARCREVLKASALRAIKRMPFSRVRSRGAFAARVEAAASYAPPACPIGGPRSILKLSGNPPPQRKRREEGGKRQKRASATQREIADTHTLTNGLHSCVTPCRGPSRLGSRRARR